MAKIEFAPRPDSEMLALLLDVAQKDPRIRAVGMEGSRVDPEAPADALQDWDIAYFVTDMASFLADDGWLAVFGPRVMLQKPEAMELYPPELGGYFTYLMLFCDGGKLDLALAPVEFLPDYCAGASVFGSLVKLLLDKDHRIAEPPVPTGAAFAAQRPTPRMADDCCNEFWFVASYVAKGLCRDELTFAAAMMDNVRRSALTMLAWQDGFAHGFGRSPGKHAKWLAPRLAADQRRLLQRTYAMGSREECRGALDAAMLLMRSAAAPVCAALGCPVPEYADPVSAYIEAMYRRFWPRP